MWRIIEDIFVKFPIIPLYGLTWVIGVYYFKKYFDTALRHFPLFIGYTFLTELLGFLVKNYPEFTFFMDKGTDWHNIIIYNIYSLVTLVYFAWLYLRLFSDQMHKKAVKIGAAVYMLSYVISLFYQDPFHEALLYPVVIESLVIVMAALFHIKELRRITDLPPQQYNLMYWVDRALLVFHIPFPIIYICAVHYYREMYKPFYLFELQLFTIVVMYILIIIGFIRSSRPSFR